MALEPVRDVWLPQAEEIDELLDEVFGIPGQPRAEAGAGCEFQGMPQQIRLNHAIPDRALAKREGEIADVAANKARDSFAVARSGGESFEEEV